MTKKQEDRLLTETETELMQILWTLGEGNVADVIKNLPESRELAYTSVSTILRILEQKKILTTRKEGRGHVYIPLLTKPEFESLTVTHMVKSVFGSPLSLARHLLNTENLSSADIHELRNLLEKLGQK